MLGFVLNVLIHGLNQKTIFIRIFRVLHTVQFSRNFVFVALCSSAATRSFYHTVSGLSRTFLTFLKKLFLLKLKRRRRDLNPRAATNDLLPFQGSPFNHLGTSALVDSHLVFARSIFSSAPGTHLSGSAVQLAERVGFEPTRPCGQTVFKTASLWPLRYLSKALSQTCSLIIPHNTIFVKHFSKLFLFFDSF